MKAKTNDQAFVRSKANKPVSINGRPTLEERNEQDGKGHLPTKTPARVFGGAGGDARLLLLVDFSN